MLLRSTDYYFGGLDIIKKKMTWKMSCVPKKKAKAAAAVAAPVAEKESSTYEVCRKVARLG
eukprot:1177395-Prorocentrum_minimum.AAC.8